MMLDQSKNLKVRVIDELGLTKEELERIRISLQNEMKNLPINVANSPEESYLESSAKSFELISLTELIITTLMSAEVIAALITLLKEWVGRQNSVKICLEIDGDKLEVTGIDSKEQKKIIYEWINRRTKGGEASAT